MTIKIKFPPSKAVLSGIAKGASFIVKADEAGITVKLASSPGRRRSQVKIFAECLSAFGRPISVNPVLFARSGPMVEAWVKAPNDPNETYDKSTIEADSLLSGPAMLRAYIAICHCTDMEASPTDHNDIAHLLWVVGTKPDIQWRWANPNGVLPVPTTGLTTVFAGAKNLVIGTNGFPLKGG